jgi:phosphatidate phosphatase APP1
MCSISELMGKKNSKTTTTTTTTDYSKKTYSTKLGYIPPPVPSSQHILYT